MGASCAAVSTAAKSSAVQLDGLDPEQRQVSLGLRLGLPRIVDEDVAQGHRVFPGPRGHLRWEVPRGDRLSGRAATS